MSLKSVKATNELAKAIATKIGCTVRDAKRALPLLRSRQLTGLRNMSELNEADVLIQHVANGHSLRMAEDEANTILARLVRMEAKLDRLLEAR